MSTAIQYKLILLAAMLYVSYFHVRAIFFGRKSLNWRSANAVVTKSDIDRESGTYHPKIIYRYSVNGQTHINDTYTFTGTGYIFKKQAIAISLKHPEGIEIQIRYNQNNPSQSVMVPGVHWSSYANLAFFLLFFGGLAFAGDIINLISGK